MKNIMGYYEKPSKDGIKEDLVLAEEGTLLTLPLAILNCCDSPHKEWDKINKTYINQNIL